MCALSQQVCFTNSTAIITDYSNMTATGAFNIVVIQCLFDSLGCITMFHQVYFLCFRDGRETVVS
jgi:hypothetical protein